MLCCPTYSMATEEMELEHACKKLRCETSSKSMSHEVSHEQEPSPSLPRSKDDMSLEEMGPMLSDDQRKVIRYVKAGHSVFFTGSAGTGKSFLLKYLIKSLPEETTFVTASTGLSAVNISGTTIHSMTGMGIGALPACVLAQNIKKKRGRKDDENTAYQRWRKCKILLLDEVSMIKAEFFEKCEQVARMVRQNDAPFGGIQLVVCGDFFQLPPVDPGKQATYAFETEVWDKCIPIQIVLNQVFRQKDQTFVDVLNQVRLGICSDHITQILQSCAHRELVPLNGVNPTKLFAKKSCVQKENHDNLAKLELEEVPFKAFDDYKERSFMDILNKNCPAERNIVLKVGAQVMLLKNLDTKRGLVNGARGIVVDFVEVTHLQSEGKKTDETKSIDGDLLDLNDAANAQKESGESALPSKKRYPLVRFTNGELCVITPVIFDVRQQQRVMAFRRQIPLTLAYAMTIHKSQGLTLDQVEIHVDEVFDDGQLYVGISRARTIEGMKIVGFRPDLIRANKRVHEFYERIQQRVLPELDP